MLTRLIISLLIILIYTAPPGLAAITRTARGTCNTCGTLSATVGTTGSSLVVITSCINNAAGTGAPSVTGITWGSVNLVLDKAQKNTSAVRGFDVEIWSAHNVTAATSTITVSWSGDPACLNDTGKIIIATELNGSTGAIVTGTTVSNSGSGTSATTASITCTPNASAQCAWIAGLMALQNNTATLTWSVPTTEGQEDGGSTSGRDVSEAFEIDSSAATQGASATITNVRWAVNLVDYLEPAVPAGCGKLLLLGVGC